jgi:hypothetical protein
MTLDNQSDFEDCAMSMSLSRERRNSIQALNVLTTEVNYINIINETFMI